MAQTRFFNFRDNVESFALSQYLLGITGAGLYKGFTFSPTANLTLTLTQTDGELITKQDGTTENVGVWGTKQGTVVRESGNITLPISASTLPRIDLIVARHTYISAVGGQTATYEVVEGTENANPVAPNVPNPQFATVLGQLTLPADCLTLDQTGVTYKKSEKYHVGNTPKVLSPHNSIQVKTDTVDGHTEYSLEANVSVVLDGSWIDKVRSGKYIGAITGHPTSLITSTNEHHGIVEVNAVQYELEDGEPFWHVTQQFTSIYSRKVFLRTLVGDNGGNFEPTTVINQSVDGYSGADANGWYQVGYPTYSFNTAVDNRLVLTVDRRINGLFKASLDAAGMSNVPLKLDGFVVNRELDTPVAGQASFTWSSGTVYYDKQVYEVPARVTPFVGLNGYSVYFNVFGTGNAKTVTIEVANGGTFSEAAMRLWNTSDYETTSVHSSMTSHYTATNGLYYKVSNGVLYLVGTVTVETNRTAQDDIVFYIPVKVSPIVPPPSHYDSATKRFYLSGFQSSVLRFEGYNTGDVVKINLAIPLG